MKIRHLVTALFLVLSLCYSLQGKSQGTATLHVQSMPGFPDLPLDSAYEGQTYSFDMLIVNNTSSFINSTVLFNMRVDSITTVFLTNPQTAMAPGDTLTINVPVYNFTQPQFKLGNNIVVVWPVVNGMVVPADSFFTNVFFVPLNSLGEFNPSEPAFHMFPVPANNTLQLDFVSIKHAEYVRIYAISGQLDREIPITKEDQIDISFLNPGIYVLEVVADGKSTRRKFIKQ
jgi:hypothetical protein